MAKINAEKAIRLVKNGTKVVGGVCIEMMSCGVLRAVLPPGVGLVVQTGALVGGLLLGGMLNEKMEPYVDRTIDETIDGYNQMASEVKRCLDVIQDKDLEKNEE